MKRIVLWLFSTLSALVLLFGYYTSTGGGQVAGSLPAIISGSATSTPSAAGGQAGNDRSGNGPATSSGASTVTGDVASTQWGPVQVQLTVDGGSVTKVSVVQYPNENSKDLEINSYALPTLIQETIDQQSADIDMVSGATVTSNGYIQSLQSALDQAGS